jgi:hypothetical protein
VVAFTKRRRLLPHRSSGWAMFVTIKPFSCGCIAANLLDVEACLDLWHCVLLPRCSAQASVSYIVPVSLLPILCLQQSAICFQEALSNHRVHHSVFAWIESFPTKSMAFDSVLMIAVAHEATSFGHPISPPGGYILQQSSYVRVVVLLQNLSCW